MSRLLSLVGADASMVEPVTDRLGHDRRYSVDSGRVRALGWRPERPLDEALAETVSWYRDNRQWWERAQAAQGRRGVKVLITGAGGQLGQDLVAAFDGWEVIAADHARLDVADRDQVLGAITSLCPDAVVHAAAWTAVDACEADPDRAFRVNALGARHVADGCRRVGAHLCLISTDYVFDGASAVPYVEWDPIHPLSVYGRSKAAGEQEALTLAPGATVVRTSWLARAPGGPNFVKTMLRLADGERRGDGRRRPARLPDLHRRSGRGRAPAGVGAAARACSTSPTRGRPRGGGWPARCSSWPAPTSGGCVPIPTAELRPARPAPRPANSVLDNAALRLVGLPLLAHHHEPLGQLVKELRA